MSVRVSAALDDGRLLEHGGEVAPERAGVHAHAAAERARDRRGELEAAEPGRAGAVQAGRVRRTAAARAATHLRGAPRRARLPGAGRARRRRRRRRARSSRARSSRPRGPPRRRLGAVARAPRGCAAWRSRRAGPPVPIVVRRASRTPGSSAAHDAPSPSEARRSGAARSTSPAPSSSSTSPGRALRAR